MVTPTIFSQILVSVGDIVLEVFVKFVFGVTPIPVDVILEIFVFLLGFCLVFIVVSFSIVFTSGGFSMTFCNLQQLAK